MDQIYGISTQDPVAACATALSYWVFNSRDRKNTPAKGLKKWDYFRSSVQNSALGARTIDDYLNELCVRLLAELRPQMLGFLVQAEGFSNWYELVADTCQKAGCLESDILDYLREKAFIVDGLCRLRSESDWRGRNEDDAIDVDFTLPKAA